MDYTTVQYCDTKENQSCFNTTNDGLDPVFVGSGDYRLTMDSPAKDSASFEELLDSGNKQLSEVVLDRLDIDGDGLDIDLVPDLDLEPRLSGCEIDKGSYEYQSACSGDADDNARVDFADVMEILGDWGDCQGCPGDVNCDDVVNFVDILVVLANWGCGITSGAPSYSEVLDDMDLDQDDLDTFLDCMENGSAAEQVNCDCWMDHYYDVHFLGICLCQPDCPDDAPFGPHEP